MKAYEIRTQDGCYRVNQDGATTAIHKHATESGKFVEEIIEELAEIGEYYWEDYDQDGEISEEFHIIYIGEAS